MTLSANIVTKCDGGRFRVELLIPVAHDTAGVMNIDLV